MSIRSLQGTCSGNAYQSFPANTDIYIPNNGLEYTFEESLYDSGDDEIFLWGYPVIHKIRNRLQCVQHQADGTKGEQIFDASCESTDGIPGCIDEIYDYRIRPSDTGILFLPIKSVRVSFMRQSYINDGPSPVWFGLTSDDEMMVLIYFIWVIPPIEPTFLQNRNRNH